MSLHVYADDTQIYCSFNVKASDSASYLLDRLSRCITEIRSWMTHSKLKMNDDKTEFIILTAPRYLDSFSHLSLTIGNSIVESADKVKNLGVLFDSCINMKSFINNQCKSAYYHLRNIGAIRKYLTNNTAAMLVHAFVTSRLDYCNSLLAGLPDMSYAKLQKVQNTAALIVTRTHKYDHITPVLINLHWLPIPLCVTYKILLLTFKALHDSGPSYLKELLTPYNPIRQLRSTSQHRL